MTCKLGNVIESVQDEFTIAKDAVPSAQHHADSMTELELSLDQNVGFSSLFLSGAGNNRLTILEAEPCIPRCGSWLSTDPVADRSWCSG